MRSYDGESSSGDEDDRREPEGHSNSGSWQRTTSHPTWAWEHRGTVRILTIIFYPAQKKIVLETSLGQSLGKSLGVLEKSLA